MKTYLLFFLSVLQLFGMKALAEDSKSLLSNIKPYAVTLSVENLEQTAKWYEEKLGFKVVKTKNYPEFSTALVFLELNGFRVELIKDGNAKSGFRRADPPKHTDVWGISQFAFETKDLKGLKNELTSKNVSVVWEYENKDLGAKFLFIRDPAGNFIQFLQRL